MTTERPLPPAARGSLEVAAGVTILLFYVAAVMSMAVLAALWLLLAVVAIGAARVGLAGYITRLMAPVGHVFMLLVGTLPYRDRFTGIDGFRRVMERFPRLRVCVAHMGAFQTAEFLALLARYPHVYIDTTMAMTSHATRYVGADPSAVTDADLLRHQDRVLFGSDFPLVPYDYDEERRWAWERALTDEVRRKIFHDNAVRFFEPGPHAG